MSTYNVHIKYRPVVQDGKVMWEWQAYISVLSTSSNTLDFVKSLESQFVYSAKDLAQTSAKGIVEKYLAAIAQKNEETYEVDL